MKKLFYFLFAAMLCGGLVCCSSDEANDSDGKKSTEELLVGTWQLYKTYEEDYGWDYYDEDSEFLMIFKFEEDGGGTLFEKDGDVMEGAPMEWSLIGSFLQICVIFDYDVMEDVMKIKSINDKELVWDWGGEIECYRRVK